MHGLVANHSRTEMPTEVLFDEEIRVRQQGPSNGMATSVVADKVNRVRVEMVELAKETLLRIDLSDPADDSFLCQKKIGASEFAGMKHEQGLDKQLKFDGFGQVVVDLLREAQCGEISAEISHVSDREMKCVRLDFVRKVACRKVTDLALTLPTVTGQELIDHILGVVKQLKEKQTRSKSTLLDLRTACDEQKQKLEKEEKNKEDLIQKYSRSQSKVHDLEEQLTAKITENEMLQTHLEVNQEEMENVRHDLDELEDLRDRYQAVDKEAWDRQTELSELKREHAKVKYELQQAHKMIVKFHEVNSENTNRLKDALKEKNTLAKRLIEREEMNKKLQDNLKQLQDKMENLETRARQAEAALDLSNSGIKSHGKENPDQLQPLPRFVPILHSDSPKAGKLGQITRSSTTLRTKTPKSQRA